ncbi:hypothetical protein DCCM_2713 [Desulfocucumis palustris]|uniref:Uncharacterized protein n=1 Tax=Desulfocucumis palustris TaxID=1898651 RepID=A0A2L2XBD0_9FIRM|nr:DUF5665 domain-containing protein [Desulfocucumis palustris]GBF33607.1 hypothetical protein DCCM_2713 [Desulfocucumis palustris]
MDKETKNLIESLRDKIVELGINMEKMKLAEYVDLLHNPWRLLWVNFTSGIARGLGIAVGFAILGAMLVLVLKKLVSLNLPVIGGFIAEIVQIVQDQLSSRRY